MDVSQYTTLLIPQNNETELNASIFNNFEVIDYSSCDRCLPNTNSLGIKVINCPNIENGVDLLTKSYLVDRLDINSTTYVVRLHIQTTFEAPISKTIKYLFTNSHKKFFLISFENSTDKSQIFWKFKHEGIFWLQLETELSNYVLQFLSTSMKVDDHSGISLDAVISLSSQSTQDIYELDILSLADSRDLNLLMLAAEAGDENSVKLLLKYAFDVDALVCDKSAVDLAWENRQYDVVLLLLETNSLYPRRFNKDDATDAIKMFRHRTRELHNYIRTSKADEANFLEEIGSILEKNPNLRHFYSTQNVSAPALALLNKNIEIYQFLVSKNIYIGPKEDFNKILKKLDGTCRQDVRGIHLEFIQPSTGKHLMILAANSFVGHDNQNADQKLKHVREAFKFLDQIHPLISLILKIVAASRDFKIIFDFHRMAVQHLDPTSNKHTKGIFYTTRHIYIAAKEMLNPTTKLKAYGTMAHELCHYALLLVYSNNCKPYFVKNDVETKLQFAAVALVCGMRSSREELIQNVFRYYEPDQQHAELAVRVPHMIVEYSNDANKLKECQQTFQELFDFAEKVTAVDIEEALPDIEVKADENIQNFAHRVEKQKEKILWLWIFCGILLMLLPVSVCLMMLLMPANNLIVYNITRIGDEVYSCENLTDVLREKIFNSAVDYQGIAVSFSYLFGDTKESCEILTTNEIAEMLKVFDQCKNAENCEDLLPLRKYSNCSSTLSANSSHATLNLSVKSALKIDKTINFKPNFHIDRKIVLDGFPDSFIQHSINGIHMSIFNPFIDTFDRKSENNIMYINLKDSMQELKFDFTELRTKNFTINLHSNFSTEPTIIIIWDEIELQSPENFLKIVIWIDKISSFTDHKQWIITNVHEDLIVADHSHKCYIQDVLKSPHVTIMYNLPVTFYQSSPQNLKYFNLFSKKSTRNKVVLLADTAGSGKSTFFRHLSWKMKENFPYFWISFVGVSQYIEAFKTLSIFETDLTSVVQFIGSNILNLNSDAEWKIFHEKFSNNEVILFWDAIDEISPDCFTQIMHIIKIIAKETGNHQWVSTRPQHQENIAKIFDIPIMKLKPYNSDDQLQFIKLFLMSKNIADEKIENSTKKIQNFINRLEMRQSKLQMVNSPQMLFMICNAFIQNESMDETANLYTFYKSYISNLYDIYLHEKHQIVMKDIKNITEEEMFPFIHQHYAIKKILKNFRYDYEKFQNLEIANDSVSSWDDKIFRYGILHFNDRKVVDFEHQTFAEYFLAEYIRSNLWDIKYQPQRQEAEARMNLLLEFLSDNGKNYKIILNFIDGFIDGPRKHANEPSRQLIEGIQDACKDITNFNFFKLKFLIKFFKVSPKILHALFDVNQSKTFFHKFLMTHPGKKNYNKISNFIIENFNENDQKRIFLGKFQNLSMILRIWKGDYGCLIAECLEENCQIIKNLKNVTNFVTAKNYSLPFYWELLLEFEDELLRTTKGSSLIFSNVWEIMDQKVPKEQIRLWLLEPNFKVQTLLFNIFDKNEQALPSFIGIFQKYFTKSEIKKMVLYETSDGRTFIYKYNKNSMEANGIVWGFINQYLNQESIKNLVAPVLDEMLVNMLYIKNEKIFEFYEKLFVDLFSNEVLQTTMLSIFPAKAILYRDPSEFDFNSCTKFVKFIQETFKGNQEGLKRLLTNEDSNTYTSLEKIVADPNIHKNLKPFLNIL